LWSEKVTESGQRAAQIDYKSPNLRHKAQTLPLLLGHAMAQLVDSLYYKPAGRGFDCRWCQHFRPGFDSAQNTLREMSTGNISWG